MTNPQIKTQAKVQAYEGISLKTIQQKGSDGQKIMAPLFDTDRNGKLEGLEVERFNNCIFKSEPGKVTMYDRTNDPEKPFVAEITYGKEGLRGEYRGKDYESTLDVSDKRNKKSVTIYDIYSGKAKIDLPKGKVTLNNLDGFDASVFADGMDVETNNSVIDYIDIKRGDLKMKNTESGGIFSSTVDVTTDGKSTVTTDKNTKADVRTEE